MKKDIAEKSETESQTPNPSNSNREKQSDSVELSLSPVREHETIQRRRSDHFLILFGILFLWPILIPLCLVSWIVKRLRKTSRLATVLPPTLALLPLQLIQVSKQNRISSLRTGIIMILPILVFALMGIFLPNADIGPDNLTPPSFQHLFGTDGLGRDILLLLLKSSVNTYLIALLVTIVSLSLGIWLGLKSINPRMDASILLVMQLVESIPSLVWILMLLTSYSFWLVSLDPDSTMHSFMERFRPILIGLLIGLCFTPNIYRMIRDKVKYFAREEFIDMTRAHGISLKRILWVHILLRNTLPDLMISGGSIPGLAILTLLNIDYFFSISTFHVGAAHYLSWTQMLLTPEARNALIFFKNLWLVFPPSILIILTTIGCYLYGSGLRAVLNLNQSDGLITTSDSYFQKTLDGWAQI